MVMPPFDALNSNVRLQPRSSSAAVDEFARSVSAGLGKPQRELPSRYLYDELGSALFDAITVLPEYGLSRADERLLRRHASAILERLPASLMVAELGSGSGRKTRWLLEALAHRGPVLYVPIDISASALQKCRQELAGLGSLSLVGLEKSYVDGLRDVASMRGPGQTLLLLFLGSTIGNFDPHAADQFLREIRGCLQPGDALLLGTDLEKGLPEMLAAYDDPIGLTAAFNLNLLARINRELHGDFVLAGFRHVIRYHEPARRIEMHLQCERTHSVSVRAARYRTTFYEGETIWTEACHKFRLDEIPAMAKRTGYVCAGQWVDREWPFAENLWIADALPP